MWYMLAQVRREFGREYKSLFPLIKPVAESAFASPSIAPLINAGNLLTPYPELRVFRVAAF